jgi:hypothetical protein
MKLQTNHLRGQTLITLLFFIVISVTVVSAAVVMILVNSRAASSLEQGMDAYYIAESGIENALLRILRNPAYAGESMTVDGGTAEINVSGSGPYTIVSTGRVGDHMKRVQVVADYVAGELQVQSWREVN